MIKEGYSSETFTLPVRHNDNMEQELKTKYATKKTLITAALIPVVASVPLIYKGLKNSFTTTTIPVASTVITPTPLIIPPPVLSTPEVIANMAVPIQQTPPDIIAEPVGLVADTSLEILANILDPLITLMVAVSFPIASVIMVGSCFFFMLGNSERAWDGIYKAALGYIVIQMSPLFLEILRQVGEAV